MAYQITKNPITKAQSYMRYYRGHANPVADSPTIVIREKEVMEGGLGVSAMNSPHYIFECAQKCIYCGATEYEPGAVRPLGEEHIIPEGLGGTLKIPEASCRKCEEQTCRTETLVLRKHLYAPRHQLSLHMKKRPRDTTSFPFTCVVDGKDVVFELPINRHPTVLFLCYLETPGILIGKPRGVSGLGGLWIAPMNNLTLAGQQTIYSPVLDTLTFCQMLAKIAHGFAVASVGSGIFEPFLTDYIRRRFEREDQWLDCYHWCGGIEKEFAPSSNLHEIAIGVAEKANERFLMVDIRLFANLGAPVYSIVVGKLLPWLKPEDIQNRMKIPKIFLPHNHSRNSATAGSTSPNHHPGMDQTVQSSNAA